MLQQIGCISLSRKREVDRFVFSEKVSAQMKAVTASRTATMRSEVEVREVLLD